MDRTMERRERDADMQRPPTPSRASSGPDKELQGRMAIVMYAVIFLYATAFWIQTGVMPFLSKNLGANPVMFGYLETVFAVSMLLGGPLFGRFGDIFGARAALLVAFLSSFLTYLTLAIASSIPELFLSRVFAFMMHAMHGAQMVMTDVSGTRERAGALGKLGVAYGFGIVVGPPIGGYVTSQYSEQFAAGIASGLCVVAMGIVLLCVPESTKDQQQVEERHREKYQSGGVFNVKAIMSLLAIPTVAYVVLLKTVIGIPAGIFHSMFTVINMDRFELTPDTNGRLLSYIGILTMVMQGFGVGFISKRISDNISFIGSIILMSLSYLLLSFTSSLFSMCLILVPMIMSGALLNTLTSSTITKVVPEAATGTSLGLTMATHSLIRSVAPTIGGYMYQWLGYSSFGLLGFVLNGAMAVLVLVSGGLPGLQ